MITINGYDLKIEDIVLVADGAPVGLAESSKESMRKSRKYIMDRVEQGEVIYGVNTGFGSFSSVSISHEQIVELQKNLIRSHCMGIGPAFTPRETRAIMLLRANALARGHSGIRIEVVEKIIEFLNANIVPVIPQQGSVGASGDLAPLSHLALSLIGEGDVWADPIKNKNKTESHTVEVAGVLKAKSIDALELHAKEGLSLINGCQVMTAVGALNWQKANDLILLADTAGALSLEALKGSRSAFDPLIAATRPHPGEAKTASNLLKIMGATSPIAESHLDCGRVQDAYSLRCIPAVHGAVKDALRNTKQVLETEANSSTDNPLVFSEEGKILSCGNFHGEPVAFSMDFSAIAMSALASISECRIEKLINPSMSGLPAFLAPDGGLNSGHMIVQVAAAALVSENKILSHPASVDSIPTSADKEDHVSMGTIAARKFGQIIGNVTNVIAMELLSGTQALDLLKPLEPSGAVKAVYDEVRKEVPFAKKDRVFSKDVEKIKELMTSGKILSRVITETGDLEW